MEDIRSISNFLSDYTTTLLSAGTHTSRTVRNATRIAHALGCDLQMTIFQQHITISVSMINSSEERHTAVQKIQHSSFNFEIISRLSSLSWEAIDDHLPFDEIHSKYQEIISKPRMSRWLVLLLVALANASFCRLFDGDLVAIGLVFCATAVGFFVRQELHKRKVHTLGMCVIVSFIASFIASLGLYWNLGNTPEIAVATSILFLIPGVPLINSIIDTLEGYILMGTSRAINALLMVICLAIGMSISFVTLGMSAL